jgi:hypothetical protein
MYELAQANLASWLDVTVQNDTNRTVKVSLCYDRPACRNREVTDTVTPHDFVQDAVGNDRPGVACFRVESPRRPPRCLFVSYREGQPPLATERDAGTGLPAAPGVPSLRRAPALRVC